MVAIQVKLIVQKIQSAFTHPGVLSFWEILDIDGNWVCQSSEKQKTKQKALYKNKKYAIQNCPLMQLARNSMKPLILTMPENIIYGLENSN